MVEECYHGTGTITTQLPRPVPCLRLGVQLPQSADVKYTKWLRHSLDTTIALSVRIGIL